MIKRRLTSRALVVACLAVVGLTAASCTTPGPPPGLNWGFRGTSMTVNNVQDEVCVIICVNTEDEPYLMQVWFRVQIGVPFSASAGVVKGSSFSGMSAGESKSLVGGEQAQVTFPNVIPMDVLDLLNPARHLEVFGTYTWAAEEDTIDSLTGGAGSIANIFKDALNGSLAQSTMPSDENAIVNLVLGALFGNGLGTPFNLIVSNIPCLGLCDDVLGGGLYVGLGAVGALAGLLDAVIGGVSIPTFQIPIVDVPPDIQGGGIYTMGGGKNFNTQFSGADGVHTYNFQSGPG